MEMISKHKTDSLTYGKIISVRGSVVDVWFENNIDQLDKELPKEKDSREAAINKELLNLEKIVSKLGEKYISTMRHSMKSFTEHVSKAHHNVLVDFIIPLSIPGLTDS